MCVAVEIYSVALRIVELNAKRPKIRNVFYEHVCDNYLAHFYFHTHKLCGRFLNEIYRLRFSPDKN